MFSHAAYSYRVRQKLPDIPTWDGLPRPSQLFRKKSRYEEILQKEELPPPSPDRLMYEDKIRSQIQRDSSKREKEIAREKAAKKPKKPKPKPTPKKEKTLLGSTGWEAI